MNGNPLGESVDDVAGLMDWAQFDTKPSWKDTELARRYVEGALECLWDQAHISIGAMHGPQHFNVIAAREILQKCLAEILKDVE